LHARLPARFAAFKIRPLEGESKPSAVSLKSMIIHDHANPRTILPKLVKFRRIPLPCNNPIPRLIVPEVSLAHAARDKIKFAIDPYSLPPVKKVTRHSFF